MEEMSLEHLILKPLLDMLFQMFQWSLQMFDVVGQTFLTLDVVRDVLMLFQYITYAMFVIGVLFALIDFVTLYLDGFQPQIFPVLKNIGRGLFMTLFIQRIMQLMYEVVHYFMRMLIHTKKESAFTLTIEDITKVLHFQHTDVLIGVFVMSVLITLFIGVLFQVLERNGFFLLHQCVVVFYIIGICRGAENVLSAWLQQGIMLCFMNFIQLLFVGIAIAMLQNGQLLPLGIGFMLAALRIDRYLKLLLANQNGVQILKKARHALIQSIG